MKVSDRWKKSSDPKEIMSYAVVNRSEFLFEVLNYFANEKKDVEMVKKLLMSGYYTFGEISAKWEIYKTWSQPVVELLRSFLKLALSYSVFFERYTLRWDLEKKSENMFNMLVEDPLMFDFLTLESFKTYLSDEQYNKIMELRDDWKIQREPEYVIAMAEKSKTNKWEVLEYFAANDVEMFDKLLGFYKKYSWMGMYNQYKNKDISTLPECLRTRIERARESYASYMKTRDATTKRGREKKIEILKTWKNEDGSPLILFKINLITPNSRDDYYRVLVKYLNETCGIVTFCKKYRISDEKGFRKMLERFSIEDAELAKKIKERASYSQSEYANTIINTIKNICDGSESFKVAIDNAHKATYENYIEFINRYYGDDYRKRFAKKALDYYYQRLTSDNASSDIENINKKLTINEVKFIAGEEIFTEMMSGKAHDIVTIFHNHVECIRKNASTLEREKVYRPICVGLEKYGCRFSRSEYLKSKNFMITQKGQKVEVVPEMIDLALIYAKSHNLFTSYNTIRSIINAIINEKIDKTEILKDKNSNTNAAKSEIENTIEISEYFDAVDLSTVSD